MLKINRKQSFEIFIGGKNMLLFENGKQISPCIASKARYALGTKNVKPVNNKRCSLIYWTKVIDVILENNNNSLNNRDNAIHLYNNLILNVL